MLRSLGQHCLGGMQIGVQPAHVGDHVGVLRGTLHARLHPGPRALAQERHRIPQGAFGDAGVDGGLHQLGIRTHQHRTFLDGPRGQDAVRFHAHVVQQHGAADGGALPEAGPIVHHRQARRAALQNDGRQAAFGVQHLGGDPVREERARGIELAPAQAESLAVGRQARLDVTGVARVALRPRVAQPAARQHAFVVPALLRGRPGQPQQIERPEVILRNLAQRRVRRADDAKDLGQCHMRDLRAAEFAWHGNAAQTAGRIAFDLAPRQSALDIAPGRALREVRGQRMRGLDGLDIIPDAGRRHDSWRLVACVRGIGA
ncbi:hypothetical protein D3C85_1125290 [compost metagenome]